LNLGAPRPILLIEDDPTIGEALHAFFQDEGYPVTWLREGLPGPATARAAQPCVVLLDLGLPDVDGRHVLRALKADPATSAIPVVVVSATVSLLDAHERALADAVLAKPFELTTLLELIERLSPA
jgi:DNA-binding response OmpR family regulator